MLPVLKYRYFMLVMFGLGIQGRDHYAVAASMYLLYQFIERSEVHSDLLNKYRFWIIPVFNPDGYEYSTSFTNASNSIFFIMLLKQES